MKFLTNFIKKIKSVYVTRSERPSEISETRDISTPEIRDMKQQKLVMESLSCPYCQSIKFVKKGMRVKKREKIQLYRCSSCNKVFTPHSTKGKHYPLSVMLDAISIYNLGYSLEQTCKIVNTRLMEEIHQKTAQRADLVSPTSSTYDWIDNLKGSLQQTNNFVKSIFGISQVRLGVDPPGVEPGRLGLSIQSSEPAEPTQGSFYNFAIQPSTLSNWLSETTELCRFARMREFALKKFSPKEMIITATLAHRQLYRYRFHRAKCALMIKEEYQHRKFTPLQEFLEMVPGECPHQYFQEGLRASEAPLTFSKTQMIVRAKQNYATRLATFVLQSVKERKQRHEALQKFMLANDSVTVATEVPVYITRDDLLHLKTQLGFEIFSRVIPTKPEGHVEGSLKDSSTPLRSARNDNNIPVVEIVKLPKLITGHIDILQIRNGQIHILDYKPRAEKERPIEQLTLYAMALSRLTGLRLYEFKCAWFDEKDYFEFYPLHVLHKPKKNSRRRKISTNEGVYKINQDRAKILSVRPIQI